MFKAVSNKTDFSQMEREVLDVWKTHDVFQQSLDMRRAGEEFVFYDGPPFATGTPHYGHLLAGTIKDIVPRYQTMRGKFVDRRFGWDCHGLPVEYEVEQDLGISGKSDIEKMGVDVFNERCRSIVLRYTREWRETVTRMGRWVDFDRDYKTMDPTYMESIWWVFKSLWEKGLVYEGQKILPYCPRCATPLSNFETNQGYKDVVDPAITVRFKLDDEPGAFILAWTTTPWTLPSNMALAVGVDIPYVRVEDGDAVYYLAKARLGQYYKSDKDHGATRDLRGAELVGRTYEPLFPYFAGLKASAGAFRIVAGDFVSTEDGTGVVHIAPGFGEDDARLGAVEKLPAVCPMDAEGRFSEDVPDFAGRAVKAADADIMARLKVEGKLVRRDTIKHSYPHCWRCDTPLLYRAISTWFVRVEALKERLLAANAQIRWVPDHLRDGRFGKWLEGARDWAISRNRYWGTPLPIWRSEDGKEIECIGSIAELEARSGKKVTDLHKHFVDGLELPSRNGKGTLKRVPEVLDCWFESGAMPYAQAHYPFENRERFEGHFPADFIAEGLDQTRGWFYTLMVLSVALFDKPAFRNVVVNGLVLAEDGRKMSKRLKNYPDPAQLIETYGADALRLYLVYSPVVRAEDLRFSEEGVKHLMRNIIIPLWNAYSFFVTYANVDGWQPVESDNGVARSNVLDRWIVSSLETLLDRVVAALDEYDLQRAVRPFVHFIEDLTNWYIRRSRRRFWKSLNDADKAQAYATLHYVLTQLAKVAAPFMPFLSDSMFMNLRTATMPTSVHLCDFPEANQAHRDPELEARMVHVMTVVQLGRALRAAHDLKVRQPLAVLHVVSRNAATLAGIEALKDLVEDELNVKSVVFGAQETELASLKAKADFKALGAKLGPRMKEAAKVIATLDSATLERLASGQAVAIALADGSQVDLGAGDVVIERTPLAGMVVAAEGELVVALETQLTDALVREGLAREFVNKVQNLRKTTGLEVSDRIQVQFSAGDALRAALAEHMQYVNAEILSLGTAPSDDIDEAIEAWDVNGHACRIRIVKA
ncbi:MAG: isoleucine--tRNA ligase [Verrucomicrobia bacterium]|nr:isoleucine--tRNA ligase [Verrucomicrobiota bacterium]